MTNVVYPEQHFLQFLNTETPVTATAVAELLSEALGKNITKSTVSRRLKSLAKEGKVRQTPDGWLLEDGNKPDSIPTILKSNGEPVVELNNYIRGLRDALCKLDTLTYDDYVVAMEFTKFFLKEFFEDLCSDHDKKVTDTVTAILERVGIEDTPAGRFALELILVMEKGRELSKEEFNHSMEIVKNFNPREVNCVDEKS